MRHRDFVTRRFPRHKAEDVSREAFSLARNRTEHLGALVMDKPLADLFANAWLQGVADAAQVIDRLVRPPIDPSIGLVP